jgi:hypothetical protein
MSKSKSKAVTDILDLVDKNRWNLYIEAWKDNTYRGWIQQSDGGVAVTMAHGDSAALVLAELVRGARNAPDSSEEPVDDSVAPAESEDS